MGFIDDLPHALVDAFRVTLEEAAHADVACRIFPAAHATAHATPSAQSSAKDCELALPAASVAALSPPAANAYDLPCDIGFATYLISDECVRRCLYVGQAAVRGGGIAPQMCKLSPRLS